MPYPAIDTRLIPDGDAPEVSRRALSPIEQAFRNQVQAVHDAIEVLKALPTVFDAGSHGEDALKGLLIDGPHYCIQILLAVDAIPEQEAQAQESWRSMEMAWGDRR